MINDEKWTLRKANSTMCLLAVVLSDQIKSGVCQISLMRSEHRGCFLHNNVLLAFCVLLSTQSHATAHILTQWSLLLLFRVSPEPGMVWLILCTLRLAPNLALQTLPQTSILSPLWLFLPLSSSLSWVLLSVTRESCWCSLTGNRMCLGLYVCPFLF